MARKQASQLEFEMPEQEAEPAEVEVLAPVRRSRAKAESRRGFRARLRIGLFWTALAALLAGAVFTAYAVDQFLASNPRFVLPGSAADEANPNFQIAGLQYASRALVARTFTPDFGRSVYLLSAAERRRSLLAIDWVRDASVARFWPNRILVRVSERVPVAFAMLPSTVFSGATEPALIDDSGALMSIPAHGNFPLPVLFGVSRQQTRDTRRERAGLLLRLLRESGSLSGQISEVDATDVANLKTTYTIGNRVVRLMLGNRNYSSRLRNFQNHYAEIGGRLPKAREFDLRLDDRITVLGAPGNGE